jgi:hypothetical protein
LLPESEKTITVGWQRSRSRRDNGLESQVQRSSSSAKRTPSESSVLDRRNAERSAGAGIPGYFGMRSLSDRHVAAALLVASEGSDLARPNRNQLSGGARQIRLKNRRSHIDTRLRPQPGLLLFSRHPVPVLPVGKESKPSGPKRSGRTPLRSDGSLRSHRSAGR